MKPLIHELSLTGQEVNLFLLRVSTSEYRLDSKNVQTFLFPRWMGWHKFSLWRNSISTFFHKLLKGLRSSAKDTLIIRTEWNVLSILALILSFRSKARLFAISQYPLKDPKVKQKLLNKCIKYFYKSKQYTQVFSRGQSAQVIENPRTIEDFIIEMENRMLYKDKEINWLPLPYPLFDENLNSFKPIRKNDEIRIICVSKPQKRKRLQEVVTCIATLNKIIKKKIVLELCLGDIRSYPNEVRELRTVISRLGMDSIVNIHTYLSPTEVLHMMQRSDLFLLASHKEPASYSQLEAIACGLPCIMSADNGAIDMLPIGYGIRIFIEIENLLGQLIAGIENLEKDRQLIQETRDVLKRLYCSKKLYSQIATIP